MNNQIISHYRQLKKLDRGGMGEVYLADDTNLPRQVAIKFMLPEFAAVPELRSRFQHEARAAALINHPNVVTIYDGGEEKNRPYFVMEYIDGEPLAALPARQELSIDEVLDLALQICAGLGKAHQKGILHRDLKPSNILLDSDGRVKIVDFGLAKLRDTSSLTSTGEVIGTPAYMSPEQARGWKLDARSDLFSLGVILYELITRRLPFNGATREALFLTILQQEPEPLARYKRGVPLGMQSLIDRALDKDRETRYQNVESLSADLKREKKLLSGAAPPTLSLPPKREAPAKPQRQDLKPKPAAPQKTPRRSPKTIWLGVGGLLLAIVLVYLWLSREKKAADFVSLSIATTPRDATVLLDGSAIGTTPITDYRAAARKTALRILKTNYFALDTTVTLVKGREAKFTFKLKPALARVTVQVTPADAEVILDGESLTPAQWRNRPLSLGMHSLNLSREGYKPLQTQFRVIARDTTLRYTLAPIVVAEYGTIRVQAFLDGRVYIDGNLMGSISAGQGPEYDQPVGSYKVEVRGASETVSQNVTVAKGKTVTVTLRPKPTAPPPESKPTPRMLRTTSRNELSADEVKRMLAAKGFYDSDWNKSVSGFSNDYERRTIAGDEVVVDNATGLMWQRSGSPDYMTLANAQEYIRQLNAKPFAKFSNWRLPTLEEAMSLMEPTRLNGDLYIDSKFDQRQRYIWTADKQSAGVAWVADFDIGGCGGRVDNSYFVRAVRVLVGQ